MKILNLYSHVRKYMLYCVCRTKSHVDNPRPQGRSVPTWKMVQHSIASVIFYCLSNAIGVNAVSHTERSDNKIKPPGVFGSGLAWRQDAERT